MPAHAGLQILSHRCGDAGGHRARASHSPAPVQVRAWSVDLLVAKKTVGTSPGITVLSRDLRRTGSHPITHQIPHELPYLFLIRLLRSIDQNQPRHQSSWSTTALPV